MFLQKSQMFMTSTQQKPQPRRSVAHPLLSIAVSLSELYFYPFILGVKFSMPRKSLGFATKSTICIYIFLNIIIVISFKNTQEKNHKQLPTWGKTYFRCFQYKFQCWLFRKWSGTVLWLHFSEQLLDFH